MTNITKQQAQRAISLIRAAQNTDYIEAMLDTLSRFIEQSTEPGESSVLARQGVGSDAATDRWQEEVLRLADEYGRACEACVWEHGAAWARRICDKARAALREHLKARPGSLMKAPTPTTDGETR